MVRDDHMRGKEVDFIQLVADNNANAEQVSYDDAHSDVPVTGGNQTGSNVDRTEIILEFLLDVGLSKPNLSGIYPRCENTFVVDLDCG